MIALMMAASRSLQSTVFASMFFYCMMLLHNRNSMSLT